MATLHLVDASLYVFRAWFSVDDAMTDRDGWPSNAVYGFTGFLLSLLEQARPTHLALAFDEALDTSFRNAIYPPYKANREPAPESLRRQFRFCREIGEALGIACFADSRFEADDLIGSLVARGREAGCRHVIVSADKDLSQLLGEGDEQWDFARQQRWDAAGVVERFGVRPEQMADFLALTGDPVDNIPGVPGIGAKGAAALLQHFGTLEALLERLDELPYLRLRGARSLYTKLRAHGDAARVARRLTGISTQAPVPSDSAALRLRPADLPRLDLLFDQLGFGPMTRRRVRDWSARGTACPA